MAKLVIENGPDKGLEFSLTGSERFTVGRDNAAALQIKDSLASRHHFRIEIRDGAYYLCDDGSTNGTFLNGKKVSELKVEIGDRIRVGETLISILSDDVGDAVGGLIGMNLDGYRLERRIGRGGMGTVYLATQLSLDRPVAMKILADDLARNEKFIEMFQAEARAAAKLHHPNIVLAYDVGEASHKHYFAMEYVPGGSVQDRLAECRKLPISEAIGYVIEAARALEFAEQKGIVHRDIKPDNMMITENGGIKICDLGLARSFSESDEGKRSEGVAGSPHYIAPEQARGAKLDHRADIYSLGASFYRMLAGKTPFSGSSVKELIKKHITETPTNLCELNPAVPQILAHIVDRMMAKDPNARYQSAREIIEDLDALKGLDFDGEPDDPTGKTILMTDTPINAPLALEEDAPVLQSASPQPELVLPVVDGGADRPGGSEVVGGYVPPAPRPFPKKVLWLLFGVIALAALTAAGVYLYGRHLERQKWREDIVEIEKALPLHKEADFAEQIDRLPADTDVAQNLKNALKIAADIEEKYPDNEEALDWAAETRLTIEQALIARADRSMNLQTAKVMSDLMEELFAPDSECVGKYAQLVAQKTSAQTRAEKIARINALLREASESRRNDRGDIDSIPAVYKAYKNLFDEIAQYEQSIQAAFGTQIVEAQKIYSEYTEYYDQWKGKRVFDDKLKSIANFAANGEYVKARAGLQSVVTEYPVLWARCGNRSLYNEDEIAARALSEYATRILPAARARIAAAEFDPKARRYNRLDDAVAVLNDFLLRYGQGQGEVRATIEKLIAEIAALGKARAEIQDMLDASRGDAARAAAADLPDRFEDSAVKGLAAKVAAEVEGWISNAEKNTVLAEFAKVEKSVREKMLDFEFAEARQALKDFGDEKAALIGDEYKEVQDELDRTYAAQREIIKQLNAIVRLEKVYIDDSGREVESVTEEGVKLVGRTDYKAWKKLANDELCALYVALKTPADEGALRFLADVCLRKGENLKFFKLGYDFMHSLSAGGARHTEEYRKYREALADKAEAAYYALVEKINSEPDSATARRLTEEALALREFLREYLKRNPQ